MQRMSERRPNSKAICEFRDNGFGHSVVDTTVTPDYTVTRSENETRPEGTDSGKIAVSNTEVKKNNKRTEDKLNSNSTVSFVSTAF